MIQVFLKEMTKKAAKEKSGGLQPAEAIAAASDSFFMLPQSYFASSFAIGAPRHHQRFAGGLKFNVLGLKAAYLLPYKRRLGQSGHAKRILAA